MSKTGTDDAAYFDVIYGEHRRIVYAYLLGQCGDPESSQDLLQETFLRVWRHLSEVRAVPPERRRFYLLTTARNLIVDYRRRKTIRDRHAGTSATLFPTERKNNPESALIAREQAKTIDDAIRRLPPDLRMVLSLHLLGEMTSAEIGNVLEIPAGTVRYRLLRARRCIAKQLDVGNIP